MLGRSTGGSFRALRILFEDGTLGALSDAELLERFLDRDDDRAESAFGSLVDRHGAMVLSVCRRALGDPHEAQDAFQATFLALARRAGTIRRRESVASWLYGVAWRISNRMRARRSRRRAAEVRAGALRGGSGGAVAAPDGHGWAELLEEVARLPEAYRAPTVLCYLEELTNEEAAARLQIPVGTVKTRLRRARDLLRSRLSDRVEASPIALIAALRPDPATAVAANGLNRSTSQMAVLGLAGLSDPAIPTVVAGLCRGAIGLSTAAKYMTAAAGLLVAAAAIGALAAGADPIEWPAAAAPPDRIDLPAPAAKEADRPTPFAGPSAIDAGGSALPPLGVESTTGVAEGSGAFPLPVGVPLPVEDRSPGLDAPSPGSELPPRPSVEAPVLSGITIDGDLSDWPESVPIHSIDRLFSFDGRSQNYDGLEASDHLEPTDLHATFAVGYDPGRQLIYLAVSVRDDRLIVGNDSHMSTDAVEVYVDGLRSETRFTKPIPSGSPFWQHYDLSEIPVQQYVAIPGPGPIYGVDAGTNPILLGGDLDETRTRAASRREGAITTYEWAIQPFDRYPDRPTELVPGKRIGFDLAVADEDLAASEVGPAGETQMNRLTWIYWGPQWDGIKVLDAGNLGELVLGAPPPDPAAEEASGPTRQPSAEAPPVSGIAIDGDLRDWPDTVARHPIDHIQVLPPYYGWNGLEGVDLADNPDLGATFSVAYDPERQLIYLAVIVRDDRHVVGHRGFWDTDAVEVYVDGRHSEDSVPLSRMAGREAEADASEFPVLQYIGIPGEGPVFGVSRSSGEPRGPDNPILMFGDVTQTGTRMAYRREPGVTVYEWAIRAFDRYPDRPTRLVPGTRIGFDVAVADKDVPASTDAPEAEPIQDRSAWVSWYPEYHGLRYLNAANLGEIVLDDVSAATPAADDD